MRIAGFLLALPLALAAQSAPSESNVIFGMHSGLALLLDVYRPAHANGYGVVVIPGSGWHAPPGYGALPLKQSKEFVAHVQRLVGAGYTAFVITHRAAPRYHWPDAIEDAQRAVRYVRRHASRYGIRPDRIGALGGSSGGHLVCLLGTMDGAGTADDPDAVERESAKVQAVVALYPATDMAKMDSPFGSVTVTAFLGQRPPRGANSPEAKLYREASPVTYVDAGDPPFLLIHGDADRTVPYRQSEIMEAALRQAGVAVKLIRVPGGDHGPSFPGATEKMDWAGAALEWFETRLRAK